MTWDGVLVIDKPPGPTSHDVVDQVRRRMGGKVGHTGTLDPAASGVLPLVLGRAARLSRFLTSGVKEYLAWLKLGLRTDTFDLEGTVLGELTVPEISAAAVEQLLDRFRGEITQLPPMYSAVKIGGERLYRAARRGEDVDRPRRQVSIFELEVLEIEPVRWLLRIRCSAGTYIRSLADDIGRELGCGAALESLRRTRAGDFTLAQAVPLDRWETGGEEALIPMARLLPDLPALELDCPTAAGVLHGNWIDAHPQAPEGWVRLLFQGRLLALGKASASGIHPEIVVADRLDQ